MKSMDGVFALSGQMKIGDNQTDKSTDNTLLTFSLTSSITRHAVQYDKVAQVL